MKANHTPGPWMAVERQDGWAIEADNGRDMGEADAKLIACTGNRVNSY